MHNAFTLIFPDAHVSLQHLLILVFQLCCFKDTVVTQPSLIISDLLNICSVKSMKNNFNKPKNCFSPQSL